VSCSIAAQLSVFLDGLPRERVGLILKDGQVIELPNVSAEPEKSFLVLADDIMPYLNDAEATFHTHPNGGAEPSAEDMLGFQMWPDLSHWIVAPEGTARFIVYQGAVVRA
jgi:proteasome lid subunit RPN8/RPN11